MGGAPVRKKKGRGAAGEGRGNIVRTCPCGQSDTAKAEYKEEVTWMH